MGADLFDRYPDWTSQADAILGYSIKALCVDDPSAALVQTEFTQPALFVVNAMTYRARHGRRHGPRPRFLPDTVLANTTPCWRLACATSRPVCASFTDAEN